MTLSFNYRCTEEIETISNGPICYQVDKISVPLTQVYQNNRWLFMLNLKKVIVPAEGSQLK